MKCDSLWPSWYARINGSRYWSDAEKVWKSGVKGRGELALAAIISAMTELRYLTLLRASTLSNRSICIVSNDHDLLHVVAWMDACSCCSRRGQNDLTTIIHLSSVINKRRGCECSCESTLTIDTLHVAATMQLRAVGSHEMSCLPKCERAMTFKAWNCHVARQTLSLLLDM